MHVCSNDLDNNSIIYLYSIILSIFTFFIILIPFYNTLQKHFNFTIPIWIETPSIIGLYHFYLKIYDKYFWKYNFIKYIGLPKIPNLNGLWIAEIVSSHDETTKKAEVLISQAFSKFSMVLKTDESTSYTTVASFSLNNPIHKTITYSYLSKPRSSSSNSMNIHEGTATLEIFEDESKLEGYYYSGRGRLTYGDIKIERKNKG